VVQPGDSYPTFSGGGISSSGWAARSNLFTRTFDAVYRTLTVILWRATFLVTAGFFNLLAMEVDQDIGILIGIPPAFLASGDAKGHPHLTALFVQVTISN